MTFDEIEDYLNTPPDIARLENMLVTKIGSLYYAPDIGLDWDYWLKGDVAYQNSTVESWLKQEALKNNILTSSISIRQVGKELVIDYRIASEEEQATIRVKGL